MDEWVRLGIAHVYLNNEQLISTFLVKGLADDLVLIKILVLLGSGRPLFSLIDRPPTLRLDGVETFPRGIVNLRYSRS